MTLPAACESLRLDEVAALYGVTPQTLLRKSRRGEFAAAHKVGRHWWVRVETLRRWQAEQEHQTGWTTTRLALVRAAGRRGAANHG